MIQILEPYVSPPIRIECVEVVADDLVGAVPKPAHPVEWWKLFPLLVRHLTKVVGSESVSLPDGVANSGRVEPASLVSAGDDVSPVSREPNEASVRKCFYECRHGKRQAVVAFTVGAPAHLLGSGLTQLGNEAFERKFPVAIGGRLLNQVGNWFVKTQSIRTLREQV